MKQDSKSSIVEEVELRGHIIDSLLLPKVLDTITSGGGTFEIRQISIGSGRHDPSHAVLGVYAEDQQTLDEILAQISDHGATPTAGQDCRLVEADIDGALPEGFYSSTNQRTEIRLDGQWTEVADQEMDCGVVLDVDSRQPRCLPMTDVKQGMPVVVGHAGVRVFPLERQDAGHAFSFMNSSVSTEKPKRVVVREIAQALLDNRHGPGKSLLVGGPAIIHTGSGPLVSELIRRGYLQKLYAGNALATHDIEQSIFGTSLGVNVQDAQIAEAGHEHHLRAINRIRRAGSIAQAVESGALTSGIMHDCVKHDVDFLLAGSIRDDGPLPDVLTDALEAQRQMRAGLKDVTFCLMVATMLHSVAVGNLLPAWVKVVCVDINPSTVIKLADRGSFQTVGLVTDVEPFFRSLLAEVDELEKQ
ncbi:TIGR00300 family protein [Aeoliella sp. ICT_H6.2]|uniref:ornithine cyclodeaminase n=1 Tax=Aeoliella straminimaris TaxID=2954799 RepID=A0A9X2FDC7_9BACT|nr:TIGR00300 family protein [Aeoliella straminimaris]MCO6046012.1 TIGR00300 family protein [Aeoliella straminimaris]